MQVGTKYDNHKIALGSMNTIDLRREGRWSASLYIYSVQSVVRQAFSLSTLS